MDPKHADFLLTGDPYVGQRVFMKYHGNRPHGWGTVEMKYKEPFINNHPNAEVWIVRLDPTKGKKGKMKPGASWNIANRSIAAETFCDWLVEGEPGCPPANGL